MQESLYFYCIFVFHRRHIAGLSSLIIKKYLNKPASAAVAMHKNSAILLFNLSLHCIPFSARNARVMFPYLRFTCGIRTEVKFWQCQHVSVTMAVTCHGLSIEEHEKRALTPLGQPLVGSMLTHFQTNEFLTLLPMNDGSPGAPHTKLTRNVVLKAFWLIVVAATGYIIILEPFTKRLGNRMIFLFMLDQEIYFILVKTLFRLIYDLCAQFRRTDSYSRRPVYNIYCVWSHPVGIRTMASCKRAMLV